MEENFSHGGDVKSFANELSCYIDEVIDLSSNINFIKPEIDIDFNSLDISAYPSYDKLYSSIAKIYNVKPEELELFNGGSSAIFSLFKFFETRNCYIYSPAYLEYKKAAQKFNYNTYFINRFVELDYVVMPNSLVVFVNPSTPDGTFYDIDKLMKSWIELDCTILIDESFLDFTSFKSVIKYLKSYDKLYILKSMTKFYSSAGIRVGTIISNKNNIQKLKEFEPMWKISQFDQAYLKSVLKDVNFPQISRAVNIKNKELLTKILNSCKYVLNISDSSANYLLVHLKGIKANQFQELLKPYKIMIRDCSNFDFLDDSFIRVAVKSEKNIISLKKALEDVDKK
ncbi:MAG: aminotransferase class I/II-fold pyridoxal phosphate-dependent enzyme [Campylobacterota bacterium]|nr:aminotransferase class I/II-fold pyridoxal phosphate-dependent enzyme [Campylobacterota bacterium]